MCVARKLSTFFQLCVRKPACGICVYCAVNQLDVASAPLGPVIPLPGRIIPIKTNYVVFLNCLKFLFILILLSLRLRSAASLR